MIPTLLKNEFMDWVRENNADLDPAEMGQGIDEETAVRLHWDDFINEETT